MGGPDRFSVFLVSLLSEGQERVCVCVCVLCLCKHPDSREDEWVMGMHGGSAGAWNRWTERNVLKNSQAHLIYESLASVSPPPFLESK